MRELILRRIDEIRSKENNFSKSLMKWNNFSTGYDKSHVSEIDFTKCNDVELLLLFERIIRKYNSN